MKADAVRKWSVARALKTKTIRRAFAIEHSSARRLCWALPVIALISAYYLFMASSGTFRDLDGNSAYYELMEEGFRHGHLYLVLQPVPELLAAPDPFAFSNVNLWAWDASLFNGHYYLYWGPVPALFLLAYKVVLASHERFSDQWLTAIFMLGRFWAGSALILSFASRVKLRQPPWVCCLALAVFGLANPSPFIVARPHVYEACLAGGGCFLFWGILFAYWGLEVGAYRKWLFFGASVAWSLAIGCRVTNLVCVPLVMLITAGFAWYRSKRTWPAFIGECLAMGVPVTLSVLAYGWYNYARFGSVTEFGVTHQLSLQPFFSSAAYVWPNVYSYLFAPLRWSCKFPFAKITGYRELSPSLTWPPGYQSFELVAGVMRTTTWIWFALLGVWRVVDYLATRRRRLRSSNAAATLSSTEAWLLACSVATMTAVIPALSLWEASMRYAEDAVGGLLLLGTLGVFWLLNRSHPSRRTGFGLAVRGLVVVVGAQTCLMGALNGFSSYGDSFKALNPVLFEKIETTLSQCPQTDGLQQ
jgi:hypothetical protein